jgi:hypothetical protein
VTPEQAEQWASAQLAQLVRLLVTGPEQPEPKDGHQCRENGDDLHWFELSMGKANGEGLRPFKLSFGTQNGQGVNMTIMGELRAWWNPNLPMPAPLAAIESCVLAPLKPTLQDFVDEALRYVRMDLPEWPGPLREAQTSRLRDEVKAD